MKLDAERVLTATGVEPGMQVAEVRAGAGTFTLPLARRVGERGRVFAVATAAGGLAPLVDAVESGRWPQIVVREARDDRLPLPDAALDAAFVIDVLHALTGPSTLADARRALRRDGRLHVIEPESRVGEKEAVEFVERAGFRFVRAFDAGTGELGLTFRRD